MSDEEAFSLEKRLALDELRKWAEVFTEEEMDRPFLNIGKRVFSPRQMIIEVEESTEYGRYLVQMASNRRLQLAKEDEYRE